MFRKNCNKCRRPSFSSVQSGEWICPICGENLTKVKAVDAGVWDKLNRKRSNYKEIRNTIK